jgi:hypothetical protein
MSDPPSYLKTLEYSQRWGIEPMFSDFKSRGFGLAQTQIRYPLRLGRLILIMALALYWAVSAEGDPCPAFGGALKTGLHRVGRNRQKNFLVLRGPVGITRGR